MDLNSADLLNLQSSMYEVQRLLQKLSTDIKTMNQLLGADWRQVVSPGPLETIEDESLTPSFESVIPAAVDRSTMDEEIIDVDEKVMDGEEEISDGDVKSISEQGSFSISSQDSSIPRNPVLRSGNSYVSEELLNSVIDVHLVGVPIVSEVVVEISQQRIVVEFRLLSLAQKMFDQMFTKVNCHDLTMPNCWVGFLFWLFEKDNNLSIHNPLQKDSAVELAMGTNTEAYVGNGVAQGSMVQKSSGLAEFICEPGGQSSDVSTTISINREFFKVNTHSKIFEVSFCLSLECGKLVRTVSLSADCQYKDVRFAYVILHWLVFGKHIHIFLLWYDDGDGCSYTYHIQNVSIKGEWNAYSISVQKNFEDDDVRCGVPVMPLNSLLVIEVFRSLYKFSVFLYLGSEVPPGDFSKNFNGYVATAQVAVYGWLNQHRKVGTVSEIYTQHLHHQDLVDVVMSPYLQVHWESGPLGSVTSLHNATLFLVSVSLSSTCDSMLAMPIIIRDIYLSFLILLIIDTLLYCPRSGTYSRSSILCFDPGGSILSLVFSRQSSLFTIMNTLKFAMLAWCRRLDNVRYYISATSSTHRVYSFLLAASYYEGSLGLAQKSAILKCVCAALYIHGQFWISSSYIEQERGLRLFFHCFYMVIISYSCIAPSSYTQKSMTTLFLFAVRFEFPEFLCCIQGRLFQEWKWVVSVSVSSFLICYIIAESRHLASVITDFLKVLAQRIQHKKVSASGQCLVSHSFGAIYDLGSRGYLAHIVCPPVLWLSGSPQQFEQFQGLCSSFQILAMTYDLLRCVDISLGGRVDWVVLDSGMSLTFGWYTVSLKGLVYAIVRGQLQLSSYDQQKKFLMVPAVCQCELRLSCGGYFNAHISMPMSSCPILHL